MWERKTVKLELTLGLAKVCPIVLAVCCLLTHNVLLFLADRYPDYLVYSRARRFPQYRMSSVQVGTLLLPNISIAIIVIVSFVRSHQPSSCLSEFCSHL